MSLNESIVEDAALIFPAAILTLPLPSGEEKELGYAVGHGPHLAPGEYAGGILTPALSLPGFAAHEEREKREAIRRLNAEDHLVDPQYDAN